MLDIIKRNIKVLKAAVTGFTTVAVAYAAGAFLGDVIGWFGAIVLAVVAAGVYAWQHKG